MGRAGDSVEPGEGLGASSVAVLVGVLGLVAAVVGALSHQELRAEPDLAANAVYFDNLIANDDAIGSLFYFSAPKLLSTLVFGSSIDDIYLFAILSAAFAASVLAALAYLVARGFGPTAGLLAGLLLALNPRWTILASIGASDLLTASMVAMCAALWAAGKRDLAVFALFAAIVSKPTAAVCALPLAIEARQDRHLLTSVGAAVVVGLALTGAAYVILVGGLDVPGRFLVAYNAVAGQAEPVSSWLASYVAGPLSGDLLAYCWPLSLIGVVAVLTAPAADGLRRLLLMSLLLAAAHVFMAAWTDTRLYARFLWLLELQSIAFAVVGAFRLAALIPESLQLARRVAVAAAVALMVVSLTGAWEERNENYVSFFEGGVQRADPLVELLGTWIAPAETVNVALWLQPSVMRKLGRSRLPHQVEAAEVVVARGGPDARTDATWLLVTPGLYEAPGVAWVRSLATSGEYVSMATTESGEFALMRRRDTAELAELGTGNGEAF